MVDDVIADGYRRAGWWTGRRLIDRFETHVAEGAGELALVSGGDTLSRAELWLAAGAAAEEIRSVVDGSRRVVVIQMPNCTAWVVMFLAVLRAGHVPATPPVTVPEAHLRHIFQLTEPALVVCAGRNRRASPDGAIQRAATRDSITFAVAATDGALRAVHGPSDPPDRTVEVPDSTAHLMFTSSTTGPPKAVSHSEDSLGALNLQFAERFGLDHRTPVFMPSPLGHSVGAIHGARLSLLLGAPLILQEEWDAQVALELVARHRADFTAAATPFLLDLVNARWGGREPKLAPLRSFLCGGAQVPPTLLRRCRIELPNTFVTPLWGMTEGGLTTCLADSTTEQVENTVGMGLPGLELRTLDADMKLRAHGAGELVMRGPGVFNGYYGQSELYAEHIVGDRFFRTGDLARIDSDGYVSITGRHKDLIIRAGVNISPVETENAIAAHPDVVGVAVIGWPDERLGERICAVVQAGAPLDLDEVIAFCTQQSLPKRCWPERLVQVDHFPRTAAGKIRKQQLRDELVSASASTAAVCAGGAGSDRSAAR
ncbi:MAG: AMP-binding protein [Acidimicrobiaceae bacterium]|nr:AMP-binding protein [Acidimicrobiaceae bacterium]MYE08586.1 AMP-binding protein [Acidimicrobiaceae bacterium]MYI35149.1 AMP-binding protein [Acidimicrobiaceae bacterium]